MKKLLSVLFIITSVSLFAQQWPASLKGRWTFDNSSNLLQAAVGSNLVLQGSHIAITGPSVGDNAVRIGVGSYYHCYHGIPANGSGAPQKVNRYTLLIDFRVSQTGQWYTFFQTDLQNTTDGEAFINPNGQLGVSATGYSSYQLIPGEWYRLVISANLGSQYNYYLDGQLIQSGGAQTPDDRFALMPLSNGNDVLLFADENGEDNTIDVAQLAIFDTCLTPLQVAALQGYGHVINSTNIKPYLETPTPTSIYISWHNLNTSGTKVIYGTDSLLLTQSSLGNSIDNNGKRWHTAKLTGLTPNTTYYYRCISNTDTSNIFPFHTPVQQGTPGGHIRFAVIGDSQSNYNQSSLTAVAMKAKFTELYGQDWYNKVNLILHTGDLVGDGSNLASFETEFFNPFSVLSCSVPFMISIGNHEGESANFYNYMHYEDFSTYQYPNNLCEKYYSYYLGNVQFLSMNMAGAYDNSAQKQWIKDRLDESAVNTAVDYVFTMGHRPGRSELWPDGNAAFVYDSIYPLFATYPKIAMHSFGHSHNYEHGTYISNNSQNRDFRTILAGGAGGALDRWGMYTNQVDLRDVQISYDHYCYVIVDVDLDNHSYTASMYSLGNPDLPAYNVLLDSWHSVVGRNKPLTPAADFPETLCPDTTPTLIASLFNGEDSLMSSQFQLIASGGSFNTPLLDTLRDWTNVYGVTPAFVPVDKNEDIDLRRLNVPAGLLQAGSNYQWRIRYRDHNCRWSDWSAPATINIQPQANDSIGFIADTTYGAAPLTVHFTDLSSVDATAWLWDFDNDGIFDSPLRDPVWTYTTDGIYTVNLVVSYAGNLGTELKQAYIVVGANNTKNCNEYKLTMFPNPANDYVTISTFPSLHGQATIEIAEISGRILNRITACQKEDYTINLKSLSAGIYVVHINISGQSFKKLLIKM